MNELIPPLLRSVALLVAVGLAAPIVALIERFFSYAPGDARFVIRDFLFPVASVIKLLSKRAAYPGGADRAFLYLAPLGGLALMVLTLGTLPLKDMTYLDLFEGKARISHFLSFAFLAPIGFLLSGVAGGNTLGLLSSFRLALLRVVSALFYALALLSISFRRGSTRLTDLVYPENASWTDLGIVQHPLECILLLVIGALCVPQARKLSAEGELGLVAPYSEEAFGPSYLTHRLLELVTRMLLPMFITLFYLGAGYIPGLQLVSMLPVLFLKALLVLTLVEVMSRSFAQLEFDEVIRRAAGLLMFFIVSCLVGAWISSLLH